MLCIKCGLKKWGAMLLCDNCGAGSSGKITLDIALSDYRPGFVKVETPAGLAERVEELPRDPSVPAVASE